MPHTTREGVETIPEITARIRELLDRHDNFSDAKGWLPMAAEIQDALESTLVTLAHLHGLMEAKRALEIQLDELKSQRDTIW